MLCITTLFFELLITLALKLFLGFEPTDAYSLGFIMFFSAAYYMSLYSSKKYYPVRLIFLVAFLLRVFLLLWDIYARGIFTLPTSGEDTENFFRHAIRFANDEEYWKNSAVVVFGTLAKLFGGNRVLLQFILTLFSVASAHIVFRIMTILEMTVKNAKRALWFMAVLPMYAVLSSVFLRESLVTLTVAVSLLLFVRWWTGKGEAYFWLSIVFAFLGAVFHSGMIGMAFGYAGIRLLYNQKKQAYRLSFSSVFVSILFVVLFVFLYTHYSSLFFSKMDEIEELSDIASGEGRGGSSYASIAGDSSNLFRFIIFTPIRMFLFLFTPLFFQIRGLYDVVAMVFSAFFYLWVYFRVFWYLRHRENKQLMIALLLIALVIAFIFGWGGTNIGTQIRHRDKIMPVYILMLALSFEPQEYVPLRRDRFAPKWSQVR